MYHVWWNTRSFSLDHHQVLKTLSPFQICAAPPLIKAICFIVENLRLLPLTLHLLPLFALLHPSRIFSLFVPLAYRHSPCAQMQLMEQSWLLAPLIWFTYVSPSLNPYHRPGLVHHHLMLWEPKQLPHTGIADRENFVSWWAAVATSFLKDSVSVWVSTKPTSLQVETNSIKEINQQSAGGCLSDFPVCRLWCACILVPMSVTERETKERKRWKWTEARLCDFFPFWFEKCREVAAWLWIKPSEAPEVERGTRHGCMHF